MGGSKASGAGFSPFVEPRAVGFAQSRKAGFMVGVVEYMKLLCQLSNTSGVLSGTLR